MQNTRSQQRTWLVFALWMGFAIPLWADPPKITLIYPSILDRIHTQQLLQSNPDLTEEETRLAIEAGAFGRHADTAKLEQSGIPIDKIADHIRAIRERLHALPAREDPFDSQDPIPSWFRPKILCFLSADRPLEEQEKLLATVQGQFQKVYAHAPLILPRYLDPIPVSGEDIDKSFRKTMEEVAEEQRDALLETNQRTKDELTTYANATRPAATEQLIGRVALLRAIMEAFNRLIQAHRLGSLDSLAAFHRAAALSSVGASLEYLSIAYFFTWQALVEKIPLPRSWLDKADALLGPIEKQRGRRLYSATKLLGANLAINSLARPLLMQDFVALLYGTPFADQSDFWNVAANGALGVGFFTAAYLGAQRLQQNGWLLGTEGKLTLLFLGLFDVLSNFFNSDPNLRHLRIFSQGPQWGTYGLMGIASLLLPERRGRFIVIDEALLNRRAEIDALASSERNFHLKGGTDILRQFVEKSKGLAQGTGKGRCAKAIGWIGRLRYFE